MSKPVQSPLMEKLYGSEIAKIVYNRCQQLGEDFNTRVQEYVYDTIWAKHGLPLQEKSLITVVALIAANKAEQLKIHFWGFFHQGGTVENVSTILNYMLQHNYITSSEEALAVLVQAQKEYLEITKLSSISDAQSILTLDEKFKAIIDFASHIAIGNNQKTEICCKQLLENNTLSIEKMHLIMQHVAVYCGFPVEMNGRSVLLKLL